VHPSEKWQVEGVVGGLVGDDAQVVVLEGEGVCTQSN
jgi:hypothetical protein